MLEILQQRAHFGAQAAGVLHIKNTVSDGLIVPLLQLVPDQSVGAPVAAGCCAGGMPEAICDAAHGRYDHDRSAPRLLGSARHNAGHIGHSLTGPDRRSAKLEHDHGLFSRTGCAAQRARSPIMARGRHWAGAALPKKEGIPFC